MNNQCSTDQFTREALVGMIATLRGALSGLLHGDENGRQDALDAIRQTTMNVCDTDLVDGSFDLSWMDRPRPDLAAFEFNLADNARLKDELEAVYGERARVLAVLTRFLPDRCRPRRAVDPEQVDAWQNLVVFDTPQGQVSWHISDEYLHLFNHLELDDEWAWDGHTTEEKYQRLMTMKDETC